MIELPLEHPRRGYRRWQVISSDRAPSCHDAKMIMYWYDNFVGPSVEIRTLHHHARGYDAFEVESRYNFTRCALASFLRFEDAWEWANKQLSLAYTAARE